MKKPMPSTIAWQKRLSDALRRRKTIYITVAIFLAAFVVALPLIYAVAGYFSNTYRARKVVNFENGVSAVLQELTTQNREVGDLSDVQQAIVDKDILRLLTILNEEARKRSIDAFAVTDENGVIITRSRAIGKRGDIIYQTTTHGRQVAQGNEIASFEISGAGDPVFISGRPLERDGLPIGSIFAVYFAEDDFARTLRERYLPPEAEIILYTKDNGVVGASVENTGTRALLDASFNARTDWILQERLAQEITLDGRAYDARNVILQGLEGSIGGAIILLPMKKQLLTISIGLVTGLLFALVIHLERRWSQRRRSGLRYYVLLMTSAVTVGAIAYLIVSFSYNQNLTPLKQPDFTIYNSTLKLNPESDVYTVGSKQQIAIEVSSGGEAINAVGVRLSYDPDLVAVTDILTSNSFCRQDFFIKKEIDQANGLVDISCGLPSPGFSDRRGTVAELLVEPRVVGRFTILFGDDAQVLANDGFGTNVLRDATNGSYQAKAAVVATEETAEFEPTEEQPPDSQQPAALPPEPTEEPETPQPLMAVVAYSPSHPNSERWYHSNQLHVLWPAEEVGVSYRYLLDDEPRTTPSDDMATVEDNVRLDAPGDGVFFFHLQPQRGDELGPVTHFPIRIDSRPPRGAIIQAEDVDIKPGDVIRLSFSGDDDLSGIQEKFYVRVDGGPLLPVEREVQMPLVEPGTHEITLRTFDQANNYDDTTITVMVHGTTFFENISGFFRNLFRSIF